MAYIAAGTYKAHAVPNSEGKWATAWESEKGAFMLDVVFQLDDSGKQITNSFCLVNKSGAPMERTLGELKEWFGWDGLNPSDLADIDMGKKQFELVIIEEPGLKDPSKMYSKVKYVNDPDRPKGGKERKAIDAQSALAKYGSILRAVAGPQPVKSAPKAPPVANKTAPPAAPKVEVKPSTQEDCWTKINEVMSNDSPKVIEGEWFARIAKAVPGKEQDDFDAQDWGKVYAELLDMEKQFNNIK